MIRDIGKITNHNEESDKMIITIKKAISSIPNQHHKNGIYCIWKDPYMVAGCDTYINTVMNIIGINNLIKKNRYPKISSIIIHNI